MDMSPADHAFEAFLASREQTSFKGSELAMFKFFKSHPGQQMFRAVEAAIQAYEKGKS